MEYHSMIFSDLKTSNLKLHIRIRVKLVKFTP
jgi:hypothetical protein